MDTGLEKFKRKVDVEIAQNIASEESQVPFVWLAVLQTQKKESVFLCPDCFQEHHENLSMERQGL